MEVSKTTTFIQADNTGRFFAVNEEIKIIPSFAASTKLWTASASNAAE